MGTVFDAERVADGARFALKRIDGPAARDDVAISRFAREVRAASAAESKHLVRVFDVGSDAGCPFFVMERLYGEDLGARLRRSTRLPPVEAVLWGIETLMGLEAAHAKGVVHRDLKPDNLFLAHQPSEPEGQVCVKIVDFGMSKIQPLGSTAPLALTLRGSTVGTPLYMSPEQAAARSDVDARSDLYSVGAILFECLSGRPPHVGESDEAILTSIRTTHAPPIRRIHPAVPPRLAAVVDRALAFDRDQRFPSAQAMRLALTEHGAAPVLDRAERAERRRLWVAAAVALVAGIVSAVGLAWALRRS